MALEHGWTRLYAAINEAGLRPGDCSFESGSMCLDGTRTVTAYHDGRHVATETVVPFSSHERLAVIALRAGDGAAALQFYRANAGADEVIGPDMGQWLHWDENEEAPDPQPGLGSLLAAYEIVGSNDINVVRDLDDEAALFALAKAYRP